MNSSKTAALLTALILICITSIPAKAQDNTKDGAEPIVSSIDPSKLTYDYLVDGDLPADDPANKKFKTLQAAYAAAPAGTEAKPTVIGIKPNVYQITGSMEQEPSLTVDKDWITFLGLTNNRRSVVLADNRGLRQGATDDGFILDVNATGFTVKNLTIINYCNCDYEYPGDPSKNLKMRSPVITQAVALQAQGDKHVYENVALLSRLDTMFLRTTRAYFKNVYIEGTDDWVGGGKISVWQDCELVYPTGHGVLSATNAIFFNCKFEATKNIEFYKQEFGGAARPDALINCVVPVPNPKYRLAWVRGVAVPRPNQYTLTYKLTDAKGNPAVASDGTMGPALYTYSRELSDQELLAYNPWNLLRAAPGVAPDNWDPAGVRDQYEKNGQGPYRMTLKSSDKPAEKKTSDNNIYGFAGGQPAVFSKIRTGNPGVTISADVLPVDAADKAITWSTKSDIVSLSQTTGPDVVVTGNNKSDDAQYVPINATASNGFYVTAYVYVEPKYIDPPAVKSAPTLSSPSNGKVTVDYTLDLGKRADQSLISWYICDDASGAKPQKVAVSRGNQPLKTYTLMPGDVGKYVRVGIEPKIIISDPGPAVYAISAASIAATDVSSSTISPNFRNFVETASSAPSPGLLTVQGVWTIVNRDDLPGGYGARAGTGERNFDTSKCALLYFKNGDTADMQIDLNITPDKTEGTVFAVPGSPDDTGSSNSHGDIFIKYDPITKNGYSLRYWRTTKSASACTYQFYKIENGVGSPLNETQVQSGVFKRNTILTLKVTGSTISASAHNTADDQTLAMQAAITPNKFSGAGVWAIGAANIYSQMTVSYP